MRRYKESILSRFFDVGNVVLMIIATFVCVYPFFYIILYSFSDPTLVALKDITFYPLGFTLANYSSIFALSDIPLAFAISVLRSVVGTLITLFCCSLFAFTLTNTYLVGRKIIYRFLIVTLYLNAGLIPWYLTMKAYGLKDNFLLYVIPSALPAFYVILIKTFIEQLPPQLEESMRIDGASHLQIYRHLIIPLTVPILATIAVYSAVAQWNSWFDNYFLVNDPKLQTLQLTLYNYLTQAERLQRMTTQQLSTTGLVYAITPKSIQMTITAVATIPILFVYPFLQRYFVKGILLGSVKG